jgi:hypothetical protein
LIEVPYIEKLKNIKFPNKFRTDIHNFKLPPTIFSLF